MIELKLTGTADEVRNDLQVLFGGSAAFLGATVQPYQIGATIEPSVLGHADFIRSATDEPTDVIATAPVDTAIVASAAKFSAEDAKAAQQQVIAEALTAPKSGRGRPRKTDAEKAQEKLEREQQGSAARAAAAASDNQNAAGAEIGNMLGEEANAIEVSGVDLDAMLSGAGAAPVTVDTIAAVVEAPAADAVTPAASTLDALLGVPAAPIATPPTEACSIDALLGGEAVVAPPVETYAGHDHKAMFQMMRERIEGGNLGVQQLMQIISTSKKSTIHELSETDLRAALIELDKAAISTLPAVI